MSVRTSARSSLAQPGRTEPSLLRAEKAEMDTSRTRMSGPERAAIGTGDGDVVAQSPIDQILAGRFACREFCNAPVPRRTIEQILRVARFAPSGANIRPWHVYVLAGAAKDRVSTALLDAHQNSRDGHTSEYKILRQRLTRSVPQAATRFRTTLLWFARNCSNRSGGEEQTNRQELHILRRTGGIDRDHRSSPGSRKLAPPRNVRAERNARGGGARASVLSAGDVCKIPQDLAARVIDPGGADGWCGISVGKAKVDGQERLMPRADIDEFATFQGFEV
jgi:Nitroreductase family